MKVEIISRADISGGLVWDMIRDGVEVHYNGVNKDMFGGFPLFVRSKGYDDVDYYIFDDTMFGVQIEKMRKDGKYVVGGNKYGDRLELDRKFFFEEMKNIGVNVPNSVDFSKVSDGIDWLDGKDGRYVFKPSGKISDIKSLTYVSKDVDDLIDFMVWVKEKYGDNIEYVLQEYIDGEEVAISGIVVDGKVVGGYFLNFEYKPFMRYSNLNTGEMGTVVKWMSNVGKLSNIFDRVVSELGVYRGWFDLNGILKDGKWYLLEPTCFDADTEIFTDKGWKRYDEVEIGDKTLSLNPDTGVLEWKRIINKIVLDYDGEMVRIGNKELDVFVTPDHELILKKNGKYKFFNAGDVPSGGWHIPRSGEWVGKDVKYIEIPEYVEHHYLGKQHKYVDMKRDSIKIDTGVFMKFLGLYLAEGSMSRWGIQIAQSPNSKKREEIEKIIKDLGFKYTINKNGSYQISNVQLRKFLIDLGLHEKACNKFIPKQFKELKKEYLEDLLYGFYLGDGTIHKGQTIYTTSSKQLADDIQELIIKIGKVANIIKKDTKGTESIGGYTRNCDMYYIGERSNKIDAYIDKRKNDKRGNYRFEHYKGKIWDVEVEDNHTMLVRRDGKPYFSGNCRFGVPFFAIVDDMIDMKVEDLYYQIAKGELDGFNVSEDYYVGLVLAGVPFPYDIKVDKEYTQKPIKNGLFEDKNVHYFEIMMKDDEYYTSGDMGYISVVNGHGSDVRSANNMAVKKCRMIDIPNTFFRFDVGLDNRVEKVLEVL